ncbi:EGF-like domain-containing protein 2 [Pecten maximus]|uniref:EGF-like domain-containing protein 2 n=1 Tax=Pecten maximus TaxID=6579 RepID=UPI0014582A2F|nr:EGF-like domain-containing protein 2 [Pecten maximus]XP_033733320.1 EGF-like domain-containing protein 2 [Pecten maximus]
MPSFIVFTSLFFGLTFVVLVNSYCQRPGFYCQNYGKCTDQQKCDCPVGFRGFDCRIPQWVPECANNCSNHGECVTTMGSNWCYCDYGYYGENCSIKNDTVNCGPKNITIVTHLSSAKSVSLHGHPMCQFARVNAGPNVYRYELTIDRIPTPGHPCAGALHTMVIDPTTTVQMFHIEIQTGFGLVAPLDWITEFECTYKSSTVGATREKLDAKPYEVKLLDSHYDHKTNGEIPMYQEFSLEFTPSPTLRGPDAHLVVWDLVVFDSKTSRRVAEILKDGCLTIPGEERLLGPPAQSQKGIVLTFAPVNKDTFLFYDYKVKICEGQCPRLSCSGEPIPREWVGFNVHVV